MAAQRTMDPHSASSSGESLERWSDLIGRIAGRDESALEKLYDETKDVVFGCAVRILHDHAAAEEVCLDVYMKVWNQAQTFSLDRGSVLTWLVVMVRSKALDRLRREAVRRTEWMELDLVTAPGDRSPDSLAEIEMIRPRVQAILMALPDAQRIALELAFFEGMTHSEIAEKLKEPMGTIKTRVRAALAALRKGLKGAAPND